MSLWMGDVSAHVCVASLQLYMKAMSCLQAGTLIFFCVPNPARIPSNNSRTLALAAGIKGWGTDWRRR